MSAVRQNLAADMNLRASLAISRIMRYNIRKHGRVRMCGRADRAAEPARRGAVGMMSHWGSQELLRLRVIVTGR